MRAALAGDGLIVGHLETLLRRDHKLDAVDLLVPIQRERDIDVRHTTEARAVAGDAQPETDIPKQSGLRRGTGLLTPHSTGIKKDGTADSKQTKRVPIGEVALLDRQYGSLVARLISKRIAAKSSVATHLEQLIKIQVVTEARVETDVKQSLF